MELTAQKSQDIYPELTAFLSKAEKNISSIDPERKETLDELAAYIRDKGENGRPAELTFICTHNSRRSHMCQLFAAVAASWYGIEHVQTYSGGTEVTAFNPRAVSALRRAGFRIPENGGMNPVYEVSYSEQSEPLSCYSKIYSDLNNPQREFAAVMTCSDADENCPYIPGAEKRISIPYIDPKEADNTNYEAERYDERAFQIATEMLYVMQMAK